MHVIERNLEVPGGELDLIARDGATRVAIEIRTITGDADPIDAIGEDKRGHVRHLAAVAGATRVDFVGVALRSTGLVVHWVPG
jgi:Holliday junction resolvase-like predicted endonuclease